MRAPRTGRIAWHPRTGLLPLLSACIVIVLACPPTVSLAASAKALNAPVYSDPAVVVPETDPAAESSGSLGFEGTGELSAEKFGAELGAEFEALLALPPVSAEVGIETIIGSDTRMRAYTLNYPSRAVALVTFDGGRCSGSLIGPDTVFTAGHCVHTGGAGGSWRTNVRVYPGYDPTFGGAIWGSCPASWLGSVVGWTQNANEQYDYGVIKLTCNIGNTVGWFGFWWQVASLLNLETIINGYPGDKPLEQWLSVDRVRVNQALQTFYKNDTIGGFSGSGVWQDRPPGSAFCTGPCIMAVHAYGLHGAAPHSTHNHGERITKDRFGNLVNWKNAPK
jgi:glutamyl endopeptidase